MSRKLNKNVLNVTNKYYRRAETGFNKYGVTTERSDLEMIEWLDHLQDELMDATIYIEKLKSEVSRND